MSKVRLATSLGIVVLGGVFGLAAPPASGMGGGPGGGGNCRSFPGSNTGGDGETVNQVCCGPGQRPDDAPTFETAGCEDIPPPPAEPGEPGEPGTPDDPGGGEPPPPAEEERDCDCAQQVPAAPSTYIFGVKPNSNGTTGTLADGTVVKLGKGGVLTDVPVKRDVSIQYGAFHNPSTGAVISLGGKDGLLIDEASPNQLFEIRDGKISGWQDGEQWTLVSDTLVDESGKAITIKKGVIHNFSGRPGQLVEIHTDGSYSPATSIVYPSKLKYGKAVNLTPGQIAQWRGAKLIPACKGKQEDGVCPPSCKQCIAAKDKCLDDADEFLDFCTKDFAPEYADRMCRKGWGVDGVQDTGGNTDTDDICIGVGSNGTTWTAEPFIFCPIDGWEDSSQGETWVTWHRETRTVADEECVDDWLTGKPGTSKNGTVQLGNGQGQETSVNYDSAKGLKPACLAAHTERAQECSAENFDCLKAAQCLNH